MMYMKQLQSRAFIFFRTIYSFKMRIGKLHACIREVEWIISKSDHQLRIDQKNSYRFLKAQQIWRKLKKRISKGEHINLFCNFNFLSSSSILLKITCCNTAEIIFTYSWMYTCHFRVRCLVILAYRGSFASPTDKLWFSTNQQMHIFTCYSPSSSFNLQLHNNLRENIL